MKIATIIGARPQFIKAAVVSRAIDQSNGVEEVIIHTGQHFDDNMNAIFFRELGLPVPEYRLEIHSLTHGAMTGRMLEKIEAVLMEEKPDFTLVYGDTNSTLAGALAAKKLKSKLVHVEAGLRSRNMDMPEEINRIVTDRIADVLFCPSDAAMQNLKEEGFGNYACHFEKSGDVMLDAVRFYAGKAPDVKKLLPEGTGRFVLCTLHRQECTDSKGPMQQVFSALDEINREVPVVMPLHPRTRKRLAHFGITTGITIMDPVGYLEIISLVKGCDLVLTDSGGLQKEAFFLGKHCVTLRAETEWIELLDHGFNKLAGYEKENIVNCYHEMKNRKSDFNKDLYGNGKAGPFIVNFLSKL